MSIKAKILEELCPDDVWQLSKSIESILNQTVRKLPKQEVSIEERRYPTTPEGMRACLDSFFARHFFQVQDTVLNNIIGENFLPLLEKDRIRILDVGAGSGASTLGVVEMLRSLVKSAGMMRPVVIDCVFNDPCELCLSYSQYFAKQYFQRLNNHVLPGQIISVVAPFPVSSSRLEMMINFSGKFDIILLSYVLSPLFENYDKDVLARGFTMLRQYTSRYGSIVVVQDQFHEDLIQKAAELLETKAEFHTHKQKVYSEENSNEFQDYCFFSAIKGNPAVAVKPNLFKAFR